MLVGFRRRVVSVCMEEGWGNIYGGEGVVCTEEDSWLYWLIKGEVIFISYRGGLVFECMEGGKWCLYMGDICCLGRELGEDFWL